MRKETVLFIIGLLLFNNKKLFCFGVREQLSNDYYKYINGKVVEIIEDKYIPDSNHKTILKQNYIYLQNGLVLIQIEKNSDVRTQYLCYNEYFNENIESDIKLNEMIQLSYQFVGVDQFSFDEALLNIIYKENAIEISAIHLMTGVEEQQTMIFNKANKRLDTIVLIYKGKDGKAIEEMKQVFKYADNGRFVEIVQTSKWGESTTAYHYDGLLRYFSTTWFIKPFTPNSEGFVVYDGDTLKYHVISTVSGGEGKVIEKYYVEFEYDNNKNEIAQEAHYKDGRTITCETNIVEFDERQNWTHIEIFKEGKIVGEYYRRITYGQ